MALKSALLALPAPIVDALRFGRRALRLVEVYADSLAWTVLDCLRYLRHQGERPGRYTRQQSVAHIIKTYHSLEKGLSLGASRPGFGLTPALRLLDLVDEFISRYGLDPAAFVAVDALGDYLTFQKSVGHDLPLITARVADLIKRMEDIDAAERDADARGGVRVTSRTEIIEAASVDFNRFLDARHSIRHFDSTPLTRSQLVEAARLAQLAPSACNRQAGRAYCFAEPGKVRTVLSLQPGNRGFGDTAGAAIVITASLDSYAGAGERRQAIVDGSLFAMTFVYALHSLGLGSCMLAWSVSPTVDRKLREVAGIPDNEEVIVLIAAGHLPSSLRVPASVRLEIDRFATIEARDPPVQLVDDSGSPKRAVG